jgi:peptide deformylase
VIRRLRLWPDPVLACVAAQVTAFDDDLRALAADMLETMYAAPGRGLAAPQVGVSLRLFVMDVGWKDGAPGPRVIVNPVLSDASAETAPMHEGCLSIPGVSAEVVRPVAVTLTARDLDGTVTAERLSGFAALCVQHETDHLDGILTLDRIGAAERARLAPQLAELGAA